MRGFIVLCLIVLASADVSHLSGYNYQAGSGGGGFGGIGAASNLAGSFAAGGDSGNFGGFGAASNQGSSFSSGGNFGGAADGGVEKEFYTFSADEGEFDQPEASEQIANSLKQNLQVVFIKGPENRGLETAALNLAKHASDQKTAIYVLSKQADIGDLTNRLNAENSHNHNKPEVHFVKYRTPEDAHNAQTQIQNQYAALGGPSQSHDGGVAPVLDYASQGSSHVGHLGNGGSSSYGSYSHSHPSNTYVPPASSYVPPAAVPSNSYIPPASPSNAYIPPSIFRRVRL